MIELDLLLINANVLTLDGDNNKAGAIGVKNGKISALWKEKNPAREEITLSDDNAVIDLQGKTVLPGFIETHNHLISAIMLKRFIDCKSPLNQTIADIQKRISEKASEVGKETWIVGFGYDDTSLLDMRHPTKADLDAAAPDHPVVVYHISGHLCVANSVALSIAGISDSMQDPKGGRLGRDASGQLNGILYEGATMLVGSHLPGPSEEEVLSLLREEAYTYAAQGITTSTDAKMGVSMDIDDIDLCMKAIEQEAIPFRMKLMISSDKLNQDKKLQSMTAEEVDAYLRERSGGRASLDSVKLFQDGSIQGLTGALREPYFCDVERYGELIKSQEQLNREVKEWHDKGFRIAIHGNGDRAIGSILDAFEYALTSNPRSDHRHRIEHVQTATTEDLERMRKLGVAGSFFINHVYYWGDRHEKLFLGPQRAARISPLAEAKELKVLFTLHSDCPVTPISPLFLVWAAVNRVTSSGKVLGAEQRIDALTALRAMTSYGAELNFEEAETGTIESGKRADFVILEEDPTEVEPIRIKDISIFATLRDGKFIYGNSV
ncbi:exoenzyme regulatory protein AepA precursor [Paenibacillus sp. J45TS6]|uniref:amidohydrolase n=1 Tax=Paenibacillus sp. J45TS6 TaxID=2807196 RepID=UPI001B02E9BC|nr:amidohydrolase [Paenibacillus sp. J45TS6]GIP42245.1 exoenzyme regulatory protein AepA precursor [Paenibacillus sp. J45TS6]